jgi:hypothetical protein
MKKFKMAILNWCMKHIWNAITEDSFMKIDAANGTVIIGNNLLPEVETIELASEARTIVKLPIFKKINESLKYTANEMLYQKSKTIDDIIFAKAVLWILEVQEEKYKNIGKIKQKDFPKK